MTLRYDFGILLDSLQAGLKFDEPRSGQATGDFVIAYDMVSEMRADLFRERSGAPRASGEYETGSVDTWLVQAADAFRAEDYAATDHYLGRFEAWVEKRLPQWRATYPEVGGVLEQLRQNAEGRCDA